MSRCPHCHDRLGAYVAGALAAEDARALAAHLEASPECAREAEELAALWAGLGELPAEAPSLRLRARFYQTLAAEIARAEAAAKETGRVGRWLAALLPAEPRWRLVGVAALVALGAALGFLAPRPGDQREMAELRGEVRSLNELVALSLLRQDSPSERLQGVAYGRSVGADDQRVRAALYEALLRDPNDNVRLAAIDALAGFATLPAERAKLVAAVGKQTSPVVQIALLDTLIAHSRSNADLDPLARDERLDPTVRSYLRNRLGDHA
ncbi:MAG: zf-HC2 domain-containing protein [Thermoanaerobaculia bacterium]